MSLFRPFMRHKPDHTQSEARIQDESSADTLARAIGAAGLSTPVGLALHIMRPVAWISGQMLWALQPLLGTFGFRQTDRPFSLPGLAALLEREDGIDELLGRLEVNTQGDRPRKA